MKRHAGGDLVLSCGTALAAELTDAGVIDRYMFMVCPTVIGRGKNVYRDVKGEVSLRLTDSKVFESGCVMLRYERAG